MNTVEKAKAAKTASYKLAAVSDAKKTAVIKRVAELMKERQAFLLAENERDLRVAREQKISEVLYKRLVMDEKKISGMIASLNEVASLDDPVGRTIVKRELDSGLVLEQVTVPIGVIGIIFESRPDALVQISSLCIKSGNAAILKGGKEAAHSNRALFDLFVEAAFQVDAVFDNCLQLVESREDIRELLALDQYVDLMIPRGSNELVKAIQENTRIPVMGHADGICHVYLDKVLDVQMATEVVWDSKCQYAAVCNALETLLVHRESAEIVLPMIVRRLREAGVKLRGDDSVAKIVDVEPATEADWTTEYTDLILSIGIVASLDEAIDHINTYGSHHTDCIVTSDEKAGRTFMEQVDSSSVLLNCSTRFADGFRYGLGAEVGISTHKIHARGPVGVEGLLIYKYRLAGSGHIVTDYATGKKQFTHRVLGH